MSPEDRLRSLGVELPPAPKPLGSYVPARRIGNLVFISGMLPLREDKLQRPGLVGADLSVEEAQDEARVAAVNALSALKDHTGDLGRVKGCIKVTGFVASAPGFKEQPKVLNVVSDFMVEVFGDAGRHARAAVGVNVLPLNAPLEVEFIFEVSD